MNSSVGRTSTSTFGRGGSRVTSFDLEQARQAPLSHGRVFSDDEIWSNFEYFIRVGYIDPPARRRGRTVRLAAAS